MIPASSTRFVTPDAPMSSRSVIFPLERKKGTYSEDKDPLEVYRAYAGRWEIEVMFNLYKNLIDLDTVNVQGDYRLYATEFINYLSVIIDSRVKKLLASNPVASRYSFRQVFRYLSKIKRVRLVDSVSWAQNTSVKYVAELANALCIGD